MAHSQLFTAHYLLMKDGSLGAWPVIEVSDLGEVLSVELHPEGLKERPGLQLHGGLLMAGLVDAGPMDASLAYTQRVLNRHFSAGTLYLGADTSEAALYPPPYLIERLTQQACPPTFLVREASNYQIPLLERIRQLCSREPSLNWLELICEGAVWTAAQRDDLTNMGFVEPGHKSGLLVIKNLDLRKMALTDTMAIKWLSVPGQM